MLVFIGKLVLSTVSDVSMCQSFGHFSGFLHKFVLAKLATTSIWVYNPYAGGGQYKIMQKTFKITETLANGYSSEITQRGLST